MGYQRIYGDEIPPGYRICSMPLRLIAHGTHIEGAQCLAYQHAIYDIPP